MNSNNIGLILILSIILIPILLLIFFVFIDKYKYKKNIKSKAYEKYLIDKELEKIKSEEKN